jgi:hypothetical protein
MPIRITGFTTALTDIDTTPQEYLGAARNDVSHTYKYVKFTGTTAVAIGDFVCYVLTDPLAQTVDGANSAVGAGVAVAAHASGSVTYGWITTRGVMNLSTTFAPTPVAGDPLTNTGATAPAIGAIAAGAAETSHQVAVCLVVSTKTALLQCPE